MTIRRFFNEAASKWCGSATMISVSVLCYLLKYIHI
jgi:hypothetical protein